MNKICTDIEQAKKLIELRIDIDTADMSYSFNFNSETYELSTVPYKDWIVPKYAKSDKFEQVIPAWSLTALLGLMPNIDEFVPRIEKSLLYVDKHNPYCCVYGNGSYALHFYYADNPIDAAFEMVCFILKYHHV